MRWWGICVCDNKCVYVNHLARWHLFNIYVTCVGDYSGGILCIVRCIFESGRRGFNVFSQPVYRQDQRCRYPFVHGTFWPGSGTVQRRLLGMEDQ